MVERRPVPADRRRVEVVLTGPGMRVVDEVMPAFNREEAQVTSALTDDETANVTDKLAALKAALEGADIEAIKDATEALMSASQEFGQRLYEAAQAEQAAAAPTGDAGASDDDVVDAEIVDG